MSTAETIQTVARLDAGSAGISMTPEEFDAVTDYDECFNYELINGVLVVTPMASRSERSPNELLGNWLYEYGRHHPSGKCLLETVFEEYLNTRDNRRRADRVIWIARPGAHPDPQVDIPTIVIEFVSPGKAAWRRDYVEKRDEYLEAGVIEYWIVDRFRRSLTAYTREPGRPGELTIPESDIYRTPLLPGFELPLGELLAAADKSAGQERR
jgi:Uma2 family endonuclease